MQRPIIYCLHVLLALGSAQIRHVTSLSHSDVTSGSDRSDGGSGRSRVLPHRYSNWEETTDTDVSENKGPAVTSKQHQQQYHSVAADNDDSGYIYQQQPPPTQLQQQQLNSRPRDDVSEANNWQLLAFNYDPEAEKRTNSDRTSTEFSLGRSWMNPPGGGSSRYHAAGGVGGGGNGANRRDTRRQFKFGKKSTSAIVRPHHHQRQQTADIEVGSDNADDLSDQNLDKSKPTTSHKRKMIKFGKKSIKPNTFNAADADQDVDDLY